MGVSAFIRCSCALHCSELSSAWQRLRSVSRPSGTGSQREPIDPVECLCHPKPICEDSANAIVGLRPAIFGPGTPWQTWGTRPVPIRPRYGTDSYGIGSWFQILPRINVLGYFQPDSLRTTWPAWQSRKVGALLLPDLQLLRASLRWGADISWPWPAPARG